MMPSLFQAVSEHTALFKRLNLAAPEYEWLAEDLKGFISSSVLDKMESVRGGGSTESGGTLGELRRVRPDTTCVYGFFVWVCIHTYEVHAYVNVYSTLAQTTTVCAFWCVLDARINPEIKKGTRRGTYW